MADIVNLRQARKSKARQDKERRAEENRARYGRTRHEKDRERQMAEKSRRDLEAHKRDGEPATQKNTEPPETGGEP